MSMKNLLIVGRVLLGASGATAVALGLLFWTGNALALVPVHMAAGVTMVLVLWALAAVAAVARVPMGLVVGAVAWGLIVPTLGLAQGFLLVGESHWVVQVLHLLVGMIAMGLGQLLAAGARRRLRPVADSLAASEPARV
jgi:hypothetical protein